MVTQLIKDPELQKLYVELLGTDITRAKIVSDDLRKVIALTMELQKQLTVNLKITEERAKKLQDNMKQFMDRLNTIKRKL